MLPYWEYFVALKFPTPVPAGNFYALVDKNKEYRCSILPEYPDRLYCYGPQVRVYDWADFDLYVEGIETPLLQTRFFSEMIPD